ncbi:vasorin b [Callorhinchus milii]|uniref:Vasorin a n=1 Tax=Callorhinchus milii TaxID=7868 RepID=A0A4W3HS41_CALMI|nr:vasorin b [Callorhinchus milii]XP_007891853.1 vasorin b [Callorhinchus milii]XP_042196918.1 vasorin b [Callorhinchus milii]|eukprot:gi/632952436/ref/XP_007891850.1/ PREDICTED: vasorin [Callorhinchus milii]
MRPTLWDGYVGVMALVLLVGQVPVQCCPAKCNCDNGRMLWCIKKTLSAIPSDIPPDTANLYLFHNAITSVQEGDFAQLPELQLLDLSHNKIAALPNFVFQPLGGLSNLDLSFNQVTEINNETFAGLQQLERLYLQKNQIQTIQPGAFEMLVKLVELKLQDNQLHSLPPLQLPTLLLLDLSRNSILATELRLIRAPEIESLRLAGLGLSELGEDLFSNMNTLQELDLSGNQLSSVTALRHLDQLTALNISGNNQISQLKTEDFKHFQNLQKLDISSLRLMTVPQEFFGLFPNLKFLAAAKNPYNCVCQLHWFIHWVRASHVLQSREETRCHFPPGNAGKPLHTLRYEDFGCPTTTTMPATTTTSLSSLSTTLQQHLPSHLVTHPAGMAFSLDGPTAREVTPAPRQSSPKVQLCPSTECLNGGVCHLDRYRHHVCVCQPGFSGQRCETGDNKVDQQIHQKSAVNVTQITSTSFTLDLQPFKVSAMYLKGIRLTYKNKSGPDPRPVSLNIPTSLATYSVRGLQPNSTYQICVGVLGRTDSVNDPCATIQTRQMLRLAPLVQTKSNLLMVLGPTIAAVFLGIILVAAIFHYRRKQGLKQPGLGEDPPPYDMEGMKPCLQNEEIARCHSKESEGLALQSHMPLMPDSLSNNNTAPLKPCEL